MRSCGASTLRSPKGMGTRSATWLSLSLSLTSHADWWNRVSCGSRRGACFLEPDMRNVGRLARVGAAGADRRGRQGGRRHPHGRSGGAESRLRRMSGICGPSATGSWSRSATSVTIKRLPSKRRAAGVGGASFRGRSPAQCSTDRRAPKRDTARAMSQENVEIGEPVRRLFAAFNKRDWGAFSAELDPEVEYAPVEEDAVYRGPEAFLQYVERWLEAWDTFLGEAEEIESTPAEDRAFIALRFRGRGKGERSRVRRPHLLGRRVARRQALPHQRVHRPGRSPRSRGAAGVAKAYPIQALRTANLHLRLRTSSRVGPVWDLGNEAGSDWNHAAARTQIQTHRLANRQGLSVCGPAFAHAWNRRRLRRDL